jgi:hypothetical protein
LDLPKRIVFCLSILAAGGLLTSLPLLTFWRRCVRRESIVLLDADAGPHGEKDPSDTAKKPVHVFSTFRGRKYSVKNPSVPETSLAVNRLPVNPVPLSATAQTLPYSFDPKGRLRPPSTARVASG